MPVICVILGIIVLATITISYKLEHRRPSSTETADFDFHNPSQAAVSLWLRLKRLLDVVVNRHRYDDEQYATETHRRRMVRTPSYGSISSAVV